MNTSERERRHQQVLRHVKIERRQQQQPAVKKPGQHDRRKQLSGGGKSQSKRK